jgi:hypothetical protein
MIVVFPTPPFPLIAIFMGLFPEYVAFPGKVIKINAMKSHQGFVPESAADPVGHRQQVLSGHVVFRSVRIIIE